MSRRRRALVFCSALFLLSTIGCTVKQVVFWQTVLPPTCPVVMPTP